MENKLNLGCYKTIKQGWINLDKINYEGVDVICDLEKGKLPFGDDTFDIILANHILEHITNLIPLMNELHRVLKKGGELIIHSPHYNSNGVFADPTHKRGFSIKSFEYFIVKEKMINYADLKKFSSVKSKIIFETRPLMFWNYVMSPLVNISTSTQSFYERSFLKMFPSFNMEAVLIK